MEDKLSLAPYSWQQLTNGGKLPEKISSVRNDLETGEKLKFDFVLEQISNDSKAINSKTDNKFVILGSMGMYVTLNELRKNNQKLILLEQRISGGKNDYDIGVRPDELQSTMSDFGWNEESKKLQRGKVENGGQMIDIMSRKELLHFPWRQTEVENQKIFVQTPEEMIFEKINAYINPRADKNGESAIPEIKWGIDIKLIKAYLVIKNNWSEKDVKNHLNKKWNKYIEDTRYQEVPELTQRVTRGESVGQVIVDVLKKNLEKEQITDVRQELLKIFGQESEINIQSLLSSSSDTEFSASLKSLIDIQAGTKLSYGQASQKATQEYTKLSETKS